MRQIVNPLSLLLTQLHLKRGKNALPMRGAFSEKFMCLCNFCMGERVVGEKERQTGNRMFLFLLSAVYCTDALMFIFPRVKPVFIYFGALNIPLSTVS